MRGIFGVAEGEIALPLNVVDLDIVDISEPEHKARNLGLILFFTSLGFALGPLIMAACYRILHWFLGSILRCHFILQPSFH